MSFVSLPREGFRHVVLIPSLHINFFLLPPLSPSLDKINNPWCGSKKKDTTNHLKMWFLEEYSKPNQIFSCNISYFLSCLNIQAKTLGLIFIKVSISRKNCLFLHYSKKSSWNLVIAIYQHPHLLFSGYVKGIPTQAYLLTIQSFLTLNG
jgi:hypothetical protein